MHDGEMLLETVSGDDDIPDLTNWFEEDARFVVHVEWAVRIKHCKGIIAFDTDSFILSVLH